MSSEETVETEHMLVELEELRREMPIDLFLRESSEFKKIIEQLEERYHERELIIEHILQLGTGFESREALRMLSTSELRKWEARLKLSK